MKRSVAVETKENHSSTSEDFETFLLGKITIQLQHKFSTAEKADASINEIKTFVQKRFKYQQLMPQTTQIMPFNEIASRNNRPPIAAPSNERPKYNGDCHYCGKMGHKERECISKKQAQDSRREQPQQERSQYNSKLVCNSCGYTGHSAQDCRHRAKGASAIRNVPYENQNTAENRNFGKEFKPAHKRAPLNEVTEQPQFSNSSEGEKTSRRNDHALSLTTKIQKCAICDI